MLLSEILDQFEKEIPLSYQESWDVCGLQVGSRKQKISSVLFAMDPCREVIREAIGKKVQLIVTHHPIQMKGYKTIDLDTYEGEIIRFAIQNNIAIYSAHTNHDSSKHSLSRFYAEQLGLKDIAPIQILESHPYTKLVVFVPVDHTHKVLDAMFQEGAGHVGAYSHCSFRIEGTGTFQGGEGTHPFIGKPGKLEQADENRVEVIVEKGKLPRVIQAMLKAHPYEEVAYDLNPLENRISDIGLGVKGNLESPIDAASFLSTIKGIFKINTLRFAGDMKKKVQSVAICTGSGTSLLKQVIQQKIDLFITGDVKYHYALEAKRANVCLVDVGHFHSEIEAVTLLKNLFKKLFESKLKLVEYKKLKDPLEIY